MCEVRVIVEAGDGSVIKTFTSDDGQYALHFFDEWPGGK